MPTFRHGKTSISFHVTSHEYRVINALAARRGVTVSVFMREVLRAQLPNELEGLDVVMYDEFKVKLQPKPVAPPAPAPKPPRPKPTPRPKLPPLTPEQQVALDSEMDVWVSVLFDDVPTKEN